MAEKRYVIVRADRFCPRDLERNYNLKCIGSLHCDKCDLRKKYGDTREQLVNKIAQVLIKDEMKYCKWETKVHKEVCWQNNMDLAKEIVEFLGVE